STRPSNASSACGVCAACAPLWNACSTLRSRSRRAGDSKATELYHESTAYPARPTDSRGAETTGAGSSDRVHPRPSRPADQSRRAGGPSGPESVSLLAGVLALGRSVAAPIHHAAAPGARPRIAARGAAGVGDRPAHGICRPEPSDALGAPNLRPYAGPAGLGQGVDLVYDMSDLRKELLHP